MGDGEEGIVTRSGEGGALVPLSSVETATTCEEAAVSGCHGSVMVPESIIRTFSRFNSDGPSVLCLLGVKAGSPGVDVADAILALPGVPKFEPSSYPPSSAKRLCPAAGGLRSLVTVAGESAGIPSEYSCVGVFSVEALDWRPKDCRPFLRRNLWV